MQTTRRELLYLVLAGLCSLAAARAGAQVESSNARLAGALSQRSSVDIEQVPSPDEGDGGLITLALQQATMKDALRAVARQADVGLIYNDSDLPADRLVTVSVADASVERALALVLRGTELRARRTKTGIAIEPQSQQPRPEQRGIQSSLSGRVTDAATGLPISAVTMRLEEVSLATTTDSEGTYRFTAVPGGTYTLTARRVGYERVAKTIVVDQEQVTADLAMTPAPTVLDQVVTTGTVIPTEVKAIPSPVTIIMAEQIEKMHALTLPSMLRQVVPTAVGFNNPANPTSTQVSVRGTSSLRGAGNVKIFIDGVEASDYAFTPVDPASIDRIEVVRGPQAATVYGADAAGGVIQIFTKHGESAGSPRVDLRVAAGLLQTPYNGFARVPRQQYSASVNGGGDDVSYEFGSGYRRLADYVPNGEISRQSASSVHGGLHYSSRRFGVGLSARYYDNRVPLVVNPELLAAGYAPGSQPYYTKTASVNETIGAHMMITPTDWWRHEITIGVDRYIYNSSQVQPRYTDAADTLRSLQQTASRKVSIGYNTAMTRRLRSKMTGSMVLGLDHYEQEADALITERALNIVGSIKTSPAGSLTANLRRKSNTGLFAQAQIGIDNTLFVTAGVRAEDNSTFGSDYGMAVLPRAGITLVREFGANTLKLRASYGEALRTPNPGQAEGSAGSGYVTLANPLLMAEEQRGWDGGFDLVLGDKATVSVTGFTQKARDLIALLQVASTPLLEYQYQNVGEVSNKGLELEAMFSPTPLLRLAAQYGYVRSRFVSVGVDDGSIQIGDEPLGVPAHSAGASLTTSPWKRTSITAGLSYVGSVRQADFLAEYRCFASFEEPACPGSFLTQGSTRDFTISYPAFTKVNLSVTQELTSTVEAFLVVDNIANEQAYEGRNTAPVVGRNTMLGLHIRM